MTNAWPENNADTLENLCLRTCVQNPDTFCVKTAENIVSLQQNINLLPGVCDKIISTLQEDEVLDTKWLYLFQNPGTTRLTRIDLSECYVTEDHMDIVTRHPLMELILKNNGELPKNIVDCINKVGSTLRVLKFENENESGCDHSQLKILDIIDDCLKQCEPIISVSGEKLYGRDFIFNCPNLRILFLRDCDFKSFMSSADILGTILYPMRRLTHLDLSRCSVDLESDNMYCFEDLQSLMWLNISNVKIENLMQALKNICKCHKLRHLDLSNDVDDHAGAILIQMYDDAEVCLRYLMDHLPLLTSLDLSGTNLPKICHKPVVHKLEAAKSGDGFREETSVCCIKGLEGRHFDFLGLLWCPDDPCNEQNLPAKQVTGHATEEQVLISVQRYFDRKNALAYSLNHLFRFFRFIEVKNHCAALEAILLGMKENRENKQIQISGSASLFYIVKGSHKHNITYQQKRRLITCLIGAMERHDDEQTMLRNGCLTICNLTIPQDVLFCYQRLVKVLIDLLKNREQEEFVQRISIYLLNSLACQVDGSEKQNVGRLGAVEVMLDLIKHRVDSEFCDEVLEVAWSTLWNVTDETANNCEKFMDKSGMELFKKCLSVFPEKPELLRNMMGLMGNIAEVKELRPKLMDAEYISLFSDLLASESDGIEVSYNACGIFSHLTADGDRCWTVKVPSRDEVMERMVTAIKRWPLNSKRNINYRSFGPILQLVIASDTYAAQYWSVWALANLTQVYPEKYCDLLKSEGGLELLQEVMIDALVSSEIKHLAGKVVNRILNNELAEEEGEEEQTDQAMED